MKESKIGVSFKKVNSKLYCYIAYKKMRTRFPYYFISGKIDKKKEEAHVRKCVEFVKSIVIDFTLKGIHSPIESLSERITEQWQEIVMHNLGDVLTYNQYVQLKKNIVKQSTLYNTLNKFLDIKSLSKSKYKKLNFTSENIIELLDKDVQQNLLAYLYVYLFEEKVGIRYIDWILNKDLIIPKLEKFIKQQNGNIDKYLSFKMPNNLNHSIEKVLEEIKKEEEFFMDILLIGIAPEDFVYKK